MFLNKSDQLKKVPHKIIKSLKRLQPTRHAKIHLKTRQKRQTTLNHLYFNKTIIRQAISNTFYTFARDTSVHGLKHLFIAFGENEIRGKPGKSIQLANKLIWAISVMVCTVFCVVLMIFAYLNFFSTLTTTTIESINYPISEVPFPAVTFCSVNKVYMPNTKFVWDFA